MSYQARRNGEYDKSVQEQVSAQKNANNIRNAANVAIATKNPYATAAGAAVKTADKLTNGKSSETLGKALSKANQLAPGGQNLQDALDSLNDSGISDKVGDAAFAYHKYNDYINQNANQPDETKNSSTPNNRSSENAGNQNENSDYDGEGETKTSPTVKAIALISAIIAVPFLLVFVVIVSVSATQSNFEDALGASYVNGETIGGYVEIPEDEKEAQEFYKRIAEVRAELAEEGMVFESVKIVAVYNTITNENNSFTYKKMTKSKITEIAKSMFREEKNSDGEIVYIYDEELFKENLKGKIYKKQFLLYSDKKREEMANNTIEYINDYYAYIGENPSSSGVTSTGPYTSWKQYEGSWTTVQLGSSGKTIAQIGCAATSVSILIAKSGVQTTVDTLNPGTFVETLNANGGFGSGSCLGCINWAAASSVAPSFRYVGRASVKDYSKEQKLSTLKTLLEQGYYVVAEVKGDTGEHWVAIDAIQNNNILMIDPGSTSTNLWQTYAWQNTSTYVYYRVV